MRVHGRVAAHRRQRIVMVNTAISQPRHHRRAHMFLTAGFEVSVYAFGRGIFMENTYPPGVKVVNLGTIQSRQYIRRIPLLIDGARRIRQFEARTAQAPPVMQYAFGLDAAFMSTLAFDRTIPLIYEVGDIRVPLENNSSLARCIRRFESRLLRRASRLVVTAPAFLEQYFSRLDAQAAQKTVVIENKLPAEYARTITRPSDFVPNARLRLGFVGALRYRDSLLPMLDAVADRPSDYEFHVYGDGPLRDAVIQRSRNATNVYYHGPFRNPDELEKIYHSIDINYVVYDNRDPNVRMALPNKLYESIYFGRPLVVAAETDLAKRVRQLGIGFVVDPRQPGFAGKFLDSLRIDEVTAAGTRALMLPESQAVHSDDRLISDLLGGLQM